MNQRHTWPLLIFPLLIAACALPTLSLHVSRGFGTIERASGSGGMYDTRETVVGATLTFSPPARVRRIVDGPGELVFEIHGADGNQVGDGESAGSREETVTTHAHEEPIGPVLPPGFNEDGLPADAPWWGGILAKAIAAITTAIVAAIFGSIGIKKWRGKQSAEAAEGGDGGCEDGD